MANLFPTGYKNEIMSLTNTQQNAPVGYKKSINFDDETGDLVRNGKNQIETSSSIDAWIQWCINCLQTDRYSLVSYSTDFGIDKQAVFEMYDIEGKAMAEVLMEKEITEALLADDYKRTRYVKNFVFDWVGPDTVEIRFTVVGIDNAEIDIQTTIAA